MFIWFTNLFFLGNSLIGSSHCKPIKQRLRDSVVDKVSKGKSVIWLLKSQSVESQATLCNTIWWVVPLWKIGLRGHGGQIVWPHLQMFHLICHQPHLQQPPNGLVWAKADLIHWPSIVTKLAFLRPLRTSVRPLRPQLWTKKKLKRW